MRFGYVFPVASWALMACVELPARPAETSNTPQEAELPWLDGGATRPALADVLQAPVCADPVHGEIGVPGDGGTAAPAAAAGATAGAGSADAPSAPSGAGAIVITEVMPNPEALADTAGEWVELHNPDPTRAIDLAGCVLDDGGASPRSIEALRVPAGGFVTIARGEAPGFVPDLVMSLSLGNTADRVALSCDGVEIDRVSYAVGAGFPVAAGASMALDPGAFDAAENDRAAVWCLGQGDYGGGDQGTPGARNAGCFGDGGVD